MLDLTSGFRAVRADKFREFLHLLPNGFSYPTTSTMAFFRSAYPVAYVPIPVAQRIGTQPHPAAARRHALPADHLQDRHAVFAAEAVRAGERACSSCSGCGYYAYTFITDAPAHQHEHAAVQRGGDRVPDRADLRADHGVDLPAGPMTADTDTEFTDKYERTGGIGAWLVDRFYDAVRDLLQPALRPGDTMMEIGCGAGYSTERLRAWIPEGIACAGSDVGASLVDKARRRNPGTPIIQQSVYSLAMPTKSVDVLVMMEVLEHLEQPAAALAELARVARRHVLISTPREPVWRALNMARGKYLGALGNTPGHVQHWSSVGLRRAVSPSFEVQAMRCPLPWTILLLTPRL